MEGFLDKIAKTLYGEYGDEISSLNIVLPNRRAKLFFQDSLSKITSKPLWQPDFVSVDEIMERVGGLASGDHIRLITELYKSYSLYHDESFDGFYFWGEMLLADFDSIDKYLIDSRMLFTNLSDIKSLETDLSYLTPEQRDIISGFWNSFGQESGYSEEKRKFIDIWRTLWPIYQNYTESLKEQGFGYTGMVYRRAAEQIAVQKKNGSCTANDYLEGKKFVIAGFNALSECEKVLFGYISKVCKTHFFWDYDHYYLDDPEQEAGLFMRENLRMYPSDLITGDDFNSFSSGKNITVISAPSDSLQSKYAGSFLDEISLSAEKELSKETAIVLTDENLLIPVIHSIPPGIENVNVTMGYPLRLTLAYSFVERLINLQLRKKVRNNKILYYHTDVTGLLEHPFLGGEQGKEISLIIEDIISRNQIYMAASHLATYGGTVGKVFEAIGPGWENLSAYLLSVIETVARKFLGDEKRENETVKYDIEYLAALSLGITKATNSLRASAIDLSEKIFSNLIRKILQGINIPFEGEPLRGIQIMGILETRNLDFENVLILSVNDDSFPGNRMISSSFIPYNLRIAYGLPTPRHHEGVYAYYFYRLLQRACNVHVVYNSASDEKSSGEQSRYLYQLQYESPHRIVRKDIGLNINSAESEAIRIEKIGETAEKLMKFAGEEAVRLSPTAFFNFISCPLRFYFHSIARLNKEDELNEEIDAPTFGNILHNALEIIYRPMVGLEDPRGAIRGLVNSGTVSEAVDRSIEEKYAKTPEGSADGNLILIKEIVCRYINTCVLPFDASQDKFTILELESGLSGDFVFDANGVRNRVSFGGIADRIDLLSNGVLRVVDYKTGRDHRDFKGVEELFSGDIAGQNPAAVQTFIYSMLLSRKTNKEVQPSLYYVRQLNSDNYSPLLNDKSAGREVYSYSDYGKQFETILAEKLKELFDMNLPFRQCEDNKNCRWCDFNAICKR